MASVIYREAGVGVGVILVIGARSMLKSELYSIQIWKLCQNWTWIQFQSRGEPEACLTLTKIFSETYNQKICFFKL